MERLIRLLWVACALLLAGCGAGARWERPPMRSPGFHSPATVDLEVLVAGRPNVESVGEAITHLEAAFAEQLRERGFAARYARAAQGPAGPSQVRLVVETWEPGNRALRNFFGQWGLGEASMTVTLEQRLPGDVAPRLTGRVRGFLRSGTFGGDAFEAARQAGAALADVVAGHEPGID